MSIGSGRWTFPCHSDFGKKLQSLRMIRAPCPFTLVATDTHESNSSGKETAKRGFW